MEKYYKNQSGEVFAFFEDTNPYEWGHEEGSLTEISKEEAFGENKTLSQVKQEKRNELKSERDNEIRSPYLHTDGNLYDANLRTRVSLADVIKASTYITYPVMWVTSANHVVELSAESASAISIGITQREQSAFRKFAEKTNLVELATTIEQVENITW